MDRTYRAARKEREEEERQAEAEEAEVRHGSNTIGFVGSATSRTGTCFTTASIV
jgi:hypothetical protein